MDNFRMRILRNLDLAIDIALEEGIIVLKKYEDLNFYLTEIADNKINKLKSRMREDKIKKSMKNLLRKSVMPHQPIKRKDGKKQYFNDSSSSFEFSSDSSGDEETKGSGVPKSEKLNPKDDLTCIVTKIVKNRGTLSGVPKPPENTNFQKIRLNNDVLIVNELPTQDKNPVKPQTINDQEPKWGTKTNIDRNG